jgi:hypothetical protein
VEARRRLRPLGVKPEMSFASMALPIALATVWVTVKVEGPLHGESMQGQRVGNGSADGSVMVTRDGPRLRQVQAARLRSTQRASARM